MERIYRLLIATVSVLLYVKWGMAALWGWLFGTVMMNILSRVRQVAYPYILEHMHHGKVVTFRLMLYQFFVLMWLLLPLIVSVKFPQIFNIFATFSGLLCGRLVDFWRYYDDYKQGRV